MSIERILMKENKTLSEETKIMGVEYFQILAIYGNKSHFSERKLRNNAFERNFFHNPEPLLKRKSCLNLSIQRDDISEKESSFLDDHF